VFIFAIILAIGLIDQRKNVQRDLKQLKFWIQRTLLD
jgi:predicted nucleic acid-binding protein